MSNRKRVTLTFEIDDHCGYNDEAFMRQDFLQELSCCVNDPYEDTFVMRVEDADVPQEMSALEFLMAKSRMKTEMGFPGIPDIEKMRAAVAFVEKWAREHPEGGNGGKR